MSDSRDNETVTAKGTFVLSELSHGGAYRTNWHCQPPDKGMLFRVTREEWTVDRLSGLDVRDVYGFEVLDGEVRT